MRYLEIELDALSEERLQILRVRYNNPDLTLEQYASELFRKYLKLLQPQTPQLMSVPSEFLIEREQPHTNSHETR